MRKSFGSTLIGLGAFLLLAAALVRFYAYPELAKTPTNYTSDTQLEAVGATIFDARTLAPITANLAITSHTVANSSQSVPDGDTAWMVSTNILNTDVAGAICSSDPKADPKLTAGCFQQQTEQVVFDRVTGAGVTCAACGAYVDQSVVDGSKFVVKQVPIADGGAAYDGAQILKFPFRTQQHDYLQYDDATGTSTPAKFTGTGSVDGVDYDVFVQEVPVTKIGTQDLPGSVFGSSDPTVTADVMYGMKRTFWIDPITGAPINRIEERNQFFSADGTDVPAFVGTVAYTAGQVSSLASDTKAKAGPLQGMRLVYPLVALLLGAAALGGGLFLRRRPAAPAAPVTSDERPLVDA